MRYTTQEKIIGKQGQERLSLAHIGIIGMGALGSVVAQLAVRSGVGTLTIIDYDIVKEENLHRQLYEESDRGFPKVLAAKKHIEAIQSKVNLNTLLQSIEQDTVHVLGTIKADLLIDCTDNMHTKTLISNYAQYKKIPLIMGTAAGQSGYVFGITTQLGGIQTIFGKNQQARGQEDDCARLGVLNTTTTIIGSLQWQLAMDYIITGVMDKRILHYHKTTVQELLRKKVHSKDNDNQYAYFEQAQKKDEGYVRRLCGGDAFMVYASLDIDAIKKNKQLCKTLGIVDLGDALRFTEGIIMRDRIIIYTTTKEQCILVMQKLKQNSKKK